MRAPLRWLHDRTVQLPATTWSSRPTHRTLRDHVLVGSPEDLLLVLANLLRGRREDLEPIDPRRGARLVLGQQAVLLALQQSISSRVELYETLRFSPVFAGLSEDIVRHPTAWLIDLDGFIVDARAMPAHIQDEARRRGLIPDVPARAISG